MVPVIVVHGGAGAWEISSERLVQAMEVCQRAAESGMRILLENGTALDAVETAVRILEDCPILDAGRGSYLNSSGEIEMDALIMDGGTLALGAVAAVQGIPNPISLARSVMEKSDHSLLVASGAESFASEMGYQRQDITDLLSDSQKADYPSPMGETPNSGANVLSPANDGKHPTSDTVGAVALDSWGNLAAATSTGGTKGKYPGRVGDSPLVGSGAYADNWTAAVSATGHGESLMRIVISKRVCDLVSNGLSAQKACEAAIDILDERVQGRGGLISIDIRGQIGIAFNTKAMPYAHAKGDAATITGH